MFNDFSVCGRATRDPYYQEDANGVQTALFTLANEVTYKGKKQVSYVPVVFWGKNAQRIHENITKGTLLIVSGRLSIQTTRLNDKEYQQKCQLIGRDFSILSGHKTNRVEEPMLSIERAITDDSIDFNQGVD
ncbi:hypothetical protein DT351_10940 (plasmid) [Latilactobacillus curvatus]|uniref:Single-stranded DNA-binding protein n=1 Tax=Latilactobacillus curvatus TaxID=28038 RepID=A0A385AHM5_LATCU|nr:single-stranded DNA-binding protein [Latilactobacillus curvatus]AXN36856.1 hypothetical protein DT351_10940 [Latilactobacillus curvatus]